MQVKGKRQRRRWFRKLAASIMLGKEIPGDHIELMNLAQMQRYWLKQSLTTPWLQRRLAGKEPEIYEP